jgi:hypothetical protein
MRAPAYYFLRAMKSFWLAVCALATLTAPAFAQQQSLSISGIVLDSLHNERLANAVVTVADQSTNTDTLGRFVIRNVMPGRYFVSVNHPVTDSLGLTLQSAEILITDRGASVLLSIPSENSIRKLLCPGNAPADDKGIIRGRVVQAGTGTPAKTQVRLSWRSILDNEFVGQEAQSGTDERGYYTFCGLPVDFEGSIRAESERDSTGFVIVSLASTTSGIAIRPLVISSSNARTATLAGAVTDPEGHPVAGVLVDIPGTGASATTNASGSFTIRNAPAGTHMARVRKVGFGVGMDAVDIDPRSTAHPSIALNYSAAVLDQVVVSAKRSDVAALTGFDKRSLVGAGRYVTPATLAKHVSHCVLDGIPLNIPRGPDCSVNGGFTSMVSFRGVSTLQGLQPLPVGEAAKKPSASSATTACIKVWIDDIEESDKTGKPTSLRWLNREDIVGIEYYTASSAPFRLNNGQCTALVIWTIWYRGSHH